MSRRGPLDAAQRYLDAIGRGDLDRAYALLDESAQRRCDRRCFAQSALASFGSTQILRGELRAGRVQVLRQATYVLPDGTQLVLADEELPENSAEQATHKSAGKARRPPSLALRFVHNPIDFYPQDRPDVALRSFLRAIDAQRYDVLARFLPEAALRGFGEGSPSDPTSPSSPRDSLPAALDSPRLLDELRARFGSPPKALIEQIAAVRAHVDDPLILNAEGTMARLPVGAGANPVPSSLGQSPASPSSAEAVLGLESGRWRILRLQ